MTNSTDPPARRTKARKLPVWFPLPWYGRELSAPEWVVAIAQRLTVRRTLTQRGDPARAQALFETLLLGREPDPPACEVYFAGRPRWPVADLSVFEAFYLAALWPPPHCPQQRQWAERLAGDLEQGLASLYAETPLQQLDGPDALRLAEDPQRALLQTEALDSRVPLSVDLNLDDETLKLAFGVWLAGRRRTPGVGASHPIDERDLKRWRDYALLPAFDLNLWSEIQGHHYTDAFLGSALWPDPGDRFVDTTERYRKTTKPLLSQVFDWGTVNRLHYQVHIQRFLDQLAAGSG